MLKKCEYLKFIFFKWSVIHAVFSGLFGKSMFLISLAVPLSKIIPIGISFPLFKYSLGGAVLISIGFVLEKVFIPEIIIENQSASSYASKLIKRNNANALDFYGEFCFLNNYDNKVTISCDVEECVNYIKAFLPIEAGKEDLGRNVSIYQFAIVKYDLLDRNKIILRAIFTALFYTGFSLLYLPVVKAIFIVMS